MFGRLAAFLKDKAGSVAIQAAILTPLMITIIGGALDYSRMTSIRVTLSDLGDSALLAGVNETKRHQLLGATNEIAIREGEQFAKNLFIVNASHLVSAHEMQFNPVIVIEGTEIKATAEISGKLDLFIADYMGASDTLITLGNSVQVAGIGKTHFHIVLDVSGSMGIGATKQDIDGMKQLVGCAFACHNTYQQIQNHNSNQSNPANHLNIRYDVLRDNIVTLLKEIEDRNVENTITVSLYGFDSSLSARIKNEANMSAVTSALSGLTPSFGHTHISNSLSTLRQHVPDNSLSSESNPPRQVVVIMSDGWSRNEGRPINPSSCKWFENNRDANVYTMTLERLNPNNGQPEHNNGPIETAMKNCASRTQQAFTAATPEEIEEAFKALLEEIEGDLRITS